jgi:hypothetical protein
VDAVSEYPHGTNAGYGRGCRCDPCHEARYAYWIAWQARKKADLSPTAPTQRHGTYNRYRTYGCRCGACRAAVWAYERERKAARRKAATA